MKKMAFQAVPVTAGGLVAVGCMVALATASPPVNTPSLESGETRVAEHAAVEDGLPANASEDYRPGPSLTTTTGPGVAMAGAGGPNILVYDNNTMHNLAQTAANNISSSVTVAGAADFNPQLAAGGWDIVAVDCPSNIPIGGWDPLAAYVDGGGCAVMSYWFWNGDGPNAAFDVSVFSSISLDFATLESSGTPEAAAVFSGVTMPNSDWHDHWGDDGDEFNALGGAVALAHIGDADHPTMVLGNGGATIASQVIDEAGDTWLGDGSGVTLWENMMLQLECAGEPPPGARTLTGMTSSSPAELYNVSKETGEATFVCTLAADSSLSGLSFIGDRLFGSDMIISGVPGFRVGEIDRTSCDVTDISDQDSSANWHGLASEQSTGLLYSIDINDSNILKSLDPDTGTVTPIGPGDPLVDGGGMAHDDATGTLYATGTGSLYTVDKATGLATLIGPIGQPTNRPGLAYGQQTDTLYLNVGTPVNALFSVDPSTGLATLIGDNGATAGSGIDALAWLPVDLPDPCPWDLDETGSVGFSDLLSVLAAWGPCPGCPEDFDGNDVVGFSDLLKLLANWGPCPGPPPLPVPPPAGATNVIR